MEPTKEEKRLLDMGHEYALDMLELEDNMPWIKSHAKEINAVVKLGRQGKLNKWPELAKLLRQPNPKMKVVRLESIGGCT